MSLEDRSLALGSGARVGNFIYWLAGAMAALGLALAAWPLIDSMNPSAEKLNPLVSVDLSRIPPGARKTVIVRGHYLVFIVHRTPEQIAAVRADDDAEMPFPQADRERVQRDEWLVVSGYCPGLWSPYGQTPREKIGPWGGWYCYLAPDPAAYDLSGRLRTRYGRGNLEIPPYYFEDDNWLVIGDGP